jgi:hypothetical protein
LLLSVVLAMFSKSWRKAASSALLSRAIATSRCRAASAASRKPAEAPLRRGQSADRLRASLLVLKAGHPFQHLLLMISSSS